MSLSNPPAELLDHDDEERLPPGTGVLLAFLIAAIGWGVVISLVLLR